MADRQCDTFILGQTLTTDVGSSGSRALGEVHEGVRSGVIEGVADFVADILNEQMLPSLIHLNYGEASEIPTIRADFERSRNEKEMAERDRVLFKDMGLPVEKSWLHERHRVPAPDPESDDLFQPSPDGAQGELETEASLASHETEGRLETLPVQVKAREEDFSTTIDKLSANVLEDLTGVTQEWVKPVKPFFDRLAALAMSKNVTDEDFTKALIEAQNQLPELFDSLNVEVLQDSLDTAIGTAMLAGSVERYEKND
jgi:phage gp29-like protein